MFSSSMTKPFAALWRAHAYVFVGVVLYLLNWIVSPFAQGAHEWWQVVVAKAFGSLDKVAYIVLLAGLAYAVLSDALDFLWSGRIKEEMEKAVAETQKTLREGLGDFTGRLTGMSFEAVKVWIEDGRANPDQLRIVGASSLKSYFGRHLEATGNVLDFALDSIVEGSAHVDAQTWHHFNTFITIRKGDLPEHFQWEEKKTYTIVSQSVPGTVPIQIENSWKVEQGQIETVLKQLQFDVDIGPDRQVCLREWYQAHPAGFSEPKFSVSADGITLSYDGVWLALAIRKDYPIRANETRVAIYESSYISEQDRCYALALRHATKGLQVSISLEGLEGWIVKQPTASAKAYVKGGNLVDIRQPREANASVDVSGWTLPGLAVVTEWTPK